MKTIITLIFTLFVFTAVGQNLAINEVCASNTSLITDEDTTYQDFIEIYNYDTQPISLEGFGLSDDVNLPYKWVFPSVSIPANSYLLVWASDKNRTNPTQPLHTNFKISTSGETIILTHSNGNLVSQAPPTVLQTNTSVGRIPNGFGSFVIFQNPTPNQPNVAEPSPIAPPTFSHTSGFYNASFNLLLSHTDPTVSILYTTDGSEPKPENIGGVSYSYKNQYSQSPGQPLGTLLTNSYQTLTYTSALAIQDRSNQPNKISVISSTRDFIPNYFPTQPVKKATVVKACAYKNGMLSAVVTHTFFISATNAFQTSLPIVSLSLNENELFDYHNGIYVAGIDFDTWRLSNPNATSISSSTPANYNDRGDLFEKQTNFEYFKNNALVLNQKIGIRLHGGWSRTFPSKSFRLYARSEYDINNSFDHSFFTNNPYNSFKRLVLRNGGTDYDRTYFRDPLCQKVVEHLKFDTQDYQPVITYINGEYWGVLNMREYYSTHYFEQKYNIAEADLEVLEKNAEIVEGTSNAHYIAMRNYLTANNLTQTVHYDYIKTQMDVENFADYMIAETYIANWDWPHNNSRFFRKKTTTYEPNAPYGQDGRWRWLMYDVDYGFGGPHLTYTNHTLPNFDMIAWTTNPNGNILRPNQSWVNAILINLLKNQEFKNYYINRFADQINTAFLPTRIIPMIDDMKNNIASEIPEHTNRWQNGITNWNSQVQVMKTYVEQRPSYQRQHIVSNFALSGMYNLTVSVADVIYQTPSDPDLPPPPPGMYYNPFGYIKLNTIELTEDTSGVSAATYPWSGIYFNNVPITLQAIPKPGYEFSHWSGASNSTTDTITLTLNSASTIIAHFVPITNVSPQIIHYWLIDNNVVNDTPLTSLTATYTQANQAGVLDFQSAHLGYPLDNSNPNWRKASMERRNKPTPLNYFPEVNNNAVYGSFTMRGLQIKQPFVVSGNQNTMVFTASTQNFENIKVSFAVIDEGAAQNILVDYYNHTTAQWETTGLTNVIYPITAAYQTVEIDFSTVAQAVNNPNFQYRIRFSGTDMTVDTGSRVTFNNMAVIGNPIPGSYSCVYNLVKLSEDSGWSYYGIVNTTDVLFGIEHNPAAGNTLPFDASFYLQNLCNTNPNSITNTTNKEGTFVSNYYWKTTITNGTTNGFVNFRYFPSATHVNSLQNTAQQFYTQNNALNISPLIYFKTSNTLTFNSSISSLGDGLSHSFTPLIPSTTGVYGGKNYIQFNELADFHQNNFGTLIQVSSTDSNGLSATEREQLKGTIRYNSTTHKFQGFNGTDWVNFN